MPGSPAHLVRRFFDVLLTSPLNDDELSRLREWVGEEMVDVFVDQPTADQRHGFEAASNTSAVTDDRDIVIAALMHDIGKRNSGLGVIGRVLASIAIKLRLPLSHRMNIYRNHGEESARELARLEAPPLAVDFARSHHGRRPESISESSWRLLQHADQPPKTWVTIRRRITS